MTDHEQIEQASKALKTKIDQLSGNSSLHIRRGYLILQTPLPENG